MYIISKTAHKPERSAKHRRKNKTR